MKRIGYALFFIATVVLINACGEVADGVKTVQQQQAAKGATDTDNEKQVKKNYYKSGELLSEVEYLDGVKHGISKDYYESGKIHAQYEYKQGKKDGWAKKYHRSGEVYQQTLYRDDKIEQKKIYHKNGKLNADVPYKNGFMGTGTKVFKKDGTTPTNSTQNTIIATPANTNQGWGWEFYLKESCFSAKYYYGELTDGIYMNDDLVAIPANANRKKSGLLVDNTLKGKTINIVAEVQSSKRIPYLIQQKVTLK